MYYIGLVNNLRMAQAFIDYANGFGASCLLKDADEGCEIWLLNGGEHLEVIKEFEEFVAYPNQNKYLAASWTTPNQQIDFDINNDTNKNTNRILIANILSKTSIFVAIILMTCWGLYMFQPPFHYFSITPDNQGLSVSQPWRLITPALVHFSILHITFNLIWWWQLGGLVEMKQSTTKLVTLFMLSAIISNLAQYWVTGPNFGGLSGVVYALFGYCWMLGKYKPSIGINIPPAVFGIALIWLVAGYFEVLGMKIANTAHLAGLIIGCGLGWFESKKS
jgi:GlpG protein